MFQSENERKAFINEVVGPFFKKELGALKERISDLEAVCANILEKRAVEKEEAAKKMVEKAQEKAAAKKKKAAEDREKIRKAKKDAKQPKKEDKPEKKD